MKSILKRRTAGDWFFDKFNVLFMILFCIATVYPFLYLIAMSFGGSANMGFSLIPAHAETEAYLRVFSNKHIATGFFNSVKRTLLGTGITLFFTICTAYALSKKHFPNRTFWTGFIVFTMFFSGGLIPEYLLVRGLGIYNSLWAMILPGLISAYNMIIMRNSFMSLPYGLEESAKIDGANDIVILFRIVVPVSVPIIATVALWTSVGHWNAWFDCMIYIQDTSRQVLQIILRRIVLEGTSQLMELNSSVDTGTASPDSIKAATIIVATIPILLVYPFIQKYFVKGIMVGSFKG